MIALGQQEELADFEVVFSVYCCLAVKVLVERSLAMCVCQALSPATIKDHLHLMAVEMMGSARL